MTASLEFIFTLIAELVGVLVRRIAITKHVRVSPRLWNGYAIYGFCGIKEACLEICLLFWTRQEKIEKEKTQQENSLRKTATERASQESNLESSDP